MFKKMIVSMFLVLASAASVSAAELKIGVVDNRAIFSKAPQVEAINGKLQKQFADRISELKGLVDQLKKGDETLKRDGLTMTEEQRIAATRELQSLQTDYQTKQKQFQEDSKRAEQKELRIVDGIVKKAINEIAAAEGFDLILRVEVALYATKALDITDKVITKISDPAG